jgi:glycosyltransferase involved in cell wall biosynthesis
MGEIHLLNPMENACGGSEWRTFSIFRVLAERAPVTIWATAQPDRTLYGRWPMRMVEPSRNQIPRGGTFVFVGVYFELPTWLAAAGIERAILIHNIPLPVHLRYAVATLRDYGVKRIEVVATSPALLADLKGLALEGSSVQASWIHLEDFPFQAPRRECRFTAGRMNRDVREKFHESDPGLFKRMAEDGFRLRLMGGTCLAPELQGAEGIELLPAGAEAPAEFLQTLDAMIYRTANDWTEAFGRTIFEGMACGAVPVVHERGGYVAYLEHGVDSAIYRDSEEALEWLRRLRQDPALKERMALAARSKVEGMYSPEAEESLAGYYLGR